MGTNHDYDHIMPISKIILEHPELISNIEKFSLESSPYDRGFINDNFAPNLTSLQINTRVSSSTQ
ncbi:15971_t:CDS:1, partial [Funneliformis caledonium]